MSIEGKNNQEAGQYVVFSIGEQLCALPIEEVIEIIRIQTITEVPGVNEYISGMINLRGNILPVIHLSQRFNKPILPLQKKTRIIITRDNDEDIGLIVDDVMMVQHVELVNLERAPDLFNILEKDCFKGFIKEKEKLIGVLNLERALYPS